MRSVIPRHVRCIIYIVARVSSSNSVTAEIIVGSASKHRIVVGSASSPESHPESIAWEEVFGTLSASGDPLRHTCPIRTTRPLK